MLKQRITYTDYNDQERTEDFYFNFTKLELMETDLKWGGFESVVEELTKTSDGQKAYGLFKELILASYGVKSDDGRRFIKSEELQSDFEQNPACSELIIGFLQNPDLAASFVQGVLPAKLVAEVNAAKAADPNQPSLMDHPSMQGHLGKRVKSVEDVQLPEPVEEFIPTVGEPPVTRKAVEEMSLEEFAAWKSSQS